MDDFYEETVLFERRRVKITNRRVIAADGRSYGLPQIVSVQKELKVPWDGGLTLGITAGCIALLTGVILAGSQSDRMPGVGLFLAGAGVAVVSFLVREFVEENWGRHVVTIETQLQQRQIIYASPSQVDAELILRAIQVAMQVGNDAVSFRAVFYHPQLPGEHIHVEPDLEDDVETPLG